MHMHHKHGWIVGATVVSAIVGLAIYEALKAAFPQYAPASLVAQAKASTTASA